MPWLMTSTYLVYKERFCIALRDIGFTTDLNINCIMCVVNKMSRLCDVYVHVCDVCVCVCVCVCLSLSLSLSVFFFNGHHN